MTGDLRQKDISQNQKEMQEDIKQLCQLQGMEKISQPGIAPAETVLRDLETEADFWAIFLVLFCL